MPHTYGELDAIVTDLPRQDVIQRSGRLGSHSLTPSPPGRDSNGRRKPPRDGVRRPFRPVARTPAAVGASARVLAVLAVSLTTTAPVVTRHRLPVVAGIPAIAICDVNGTDTPCHITNSNGEVIQHNAGTKLDRR